MRGQQFQRIRDAGCAGVSESRGFHFGVTSPANYRAFFAGLDGETAKGQVCYRMIISTLSLFSMRSNDARSVPNKSLPWGRADHEAWVLYDADSSSRQGLAAVAQGGPRGFPAGRRTRLHRSLCRRARHRQGREHHLLHRFHRVARGRNQADQARHRHRQHAEHPSGQRSPPRSRCSITCSTDA